MVVSDTRHYYIVSSSFGILRLHVCALKLMAVNSSSYGHMLLYGPLVCV